MGGWLNGWICRRLLGAKEAVSLALFFFRVERSEWMIGFGEIEKLGRKWS
jgi:hypothetical protein